MDRIEFVVREVELGNGVQECAEPIINGESLVDLLGQHAGAHAELGPWRFSRTAYERALASSQRLR